MDEEEVENEAVDLIVFVYLSKIYTSTEIFSFHF